MDIRKHIKDERKKLDKSLVATPKTREYLEKFTIACGGSNNILAMQMAIQFGYIMALEEIEHELNK